MGNMKELLWVRGTGVMLVQEMEGLLDQWWVKKLEMELE
jgi:hypothetical protein